jgi:hypothetical protein
MFIRITETSVMFLPSRVGSARRAGPRVTRREQAHAGGYHRAGRHGVAGRRNSPGVGLLGLIGVDLGWSPTDDTPRHS